MACWFIPNTTTGREAMLSMSNTGSTAQQFAFLIHAGDGSGGNKVSALARSPTQTVFSTICATTTVGVTAGAIHRAVAVFPSTASRIIYLDGGNKVTTTHTVAPSGINNLSIGRLEDSTPNWEFDGEIWGVTIWDRALTDAEVAFDYAPSTRWDLYAPEVRHNYFVPEAGGFVPYPINRPSMNGGMA